MTLNPTVSNLYNEYYFQHGCGLPYERSEHWLKFFGGIADKIVRGINPRTVLDAGCAMGFLVEALREQGVEAFGVDISEYAIRNVRNDLKAYCWLGSILDPLPQHYDLIVCIEVLEHLPKPDSEQALANLCQASDDILFSSTPTDYREPTHFNVQPPEYWAELFAEQGFVRDVDFDAGFIAPWSARFRKNHEPEPRVLRNYERKYWSLWQENQELRRLAGELRDRIAADQKQIADYRQHISNREQDLLQLQNGLGWQLLQALQPLRARVVPPGSWQERAAFRILRGLRTLEKKALTR